jgi:hypothetical protein
MGVKEKEKKKSTGTNQGLREDFGLQSCASPTAKYLTTSPNAGEIEFPISFVGGLERFSFQFLSTNFLSENVKNAVHYSEHSYPIVYIPRK